MVLCEVRQCNNLLYGGHWFLKYGDKKKGFSLEEENYNNKGIMFYFNLIKLIIKTIISIFFLFTDFFLESKLMLAITWNLICNL